MSRPSASSSPAPQQPPISLPFLQRDKLASDVQPRPPPQYTGQWYFLLRPLKNCLHPIDTKLRPFNTSQRLLRFGMVVQCIGITTHVLLSVQGSYRDNASTCTPSCGWQDRRLPFVLPATAIQLSWDARHPSPLSCSSCNIT